MRRTPGAQRIEKARSLSTVAVGAFQTEEKKASFTARHHSIL